MSEGDSTPHSTPSPVPTKEDDDDYVVHSPRGVDYPLDHPIITTTDPDDDDVCFGSTGLRRQGNRRWWDDVKLAVETFEHFSSDGVVAFVRDRDRGRKYWIRPERRHRGGPPMPPVTRGKTTWRLATDKEIRDQTFQRFRYQRCINKKQLNGQKDKEQENPKAPRAKKKPRKKSSTGTTSRKAKPQGENCIDKKQPAASATGGETLLGGGSTQLQDVNPPQPSLALCYPPGGNGGSLLDNTCIGGITSSGLGHLLLQGEQLSSEFGRSTTTAEKQDFLGTGAGNELPGDEGISPQELALLLQQNKMLGQHKAELSLLYEKRTELKGLEELLRDQLKDIRFKLHELHKYEVRLLSRIKSLEAKKAQSRLFTNTPNGRNTGDQLNADLFSAARQVLSQCPADNGQQSGLLGRAVEKQLNVDTQSAVLEDARRFLSKGRPPIAEKGAFFGTNDNAGKDIFDDLPPGALEPMRLDGHGGDEKMDLDNIEVWNLSDDKNKSFLFDGMEDEKMEQDVEIWRYILLDDKYRSILSHQTADVDAADELKGKPKKKTVASRNHRSGSGESKKDSYSNATQQFAVATKPATPQTIVKTKDAGKAAVGGAFKKAPNTSSRRRGPQEDDDADVPLSRPQRPRYQEDKAWKKVGPRQGEGKVASAVPVDNGTRYLNSLDGTHGKNRSPAGQNKDMIAGYQDIESQPDPDATRDSADVHPPRPPKTEGGVGEKDFPRLSDENDYDDDYDNDDTYLYGDAEDDALGNGDTDYSSKTERVVASQGVLRTAQRQSSSLENFESRYMGAAMPSEGHLDAKVKPQTHHGSGAASRNGGRGVDVNQLVDRFNNLCNLVSTRDKPI